jgi:hypothetical protein
MKLVRPIFAIVLPFLFSFSLFAFQRGRQRSYYSGGPSVPSEFYFSRLQFNTIYGGGGYRGTWDQDWPKADDDCLIALRRLTRINSPSPLNVADLDSDHLFDYPWIYSINPQTWAFSDAEAKRLHDYLLKGGFMMVDHFHGTEDWERFMSGMRQVLPDAQVEDLDGVDEIYHVLYDINERFQIPGEQYVRSGITYECGGRNGNDCGYQAKWRAIRNDHGRIMVAICHNMHLGDAWEHSDEASYPEKFSGLAFRIVLNYITYAMTH